MSTSVHPEHVFGMSGSEERVSEVRVQEGLWGVERAEENKAEGRQAVVVGRQERVEMQKAAVGCFSSDTLSKS